MRDSPIEGQGLFATVDLPAGTIIAWLGGHLVTREELDALMAAASGPGGTFVDSITVGENAHLVLPPNQPIHYGNHSCDPNLWHADAFTIVARRDISAGEELTIDYGTQSGSEDWRMECGCRSPLCRGIVTGADWRLESLQRRYGDHWVPALLARIKAVRD